jgi:hypothetical protein
VVVVASGDLDADGVARLDALLRKGDKDVVVDVWDVTHFDADGAAALKNAKARADEAGWGLAVVADPAGPCIEPLEAAGMPTFADRRAARAALQQRGYS